MKRELKYFRINISGNLAWSANIWTMYRFGKTTSPFNSSEFKWSIL